MLAGHVGESASVSGAGIESQTRRMPEPVFTRLPEPPSKPSRGAAAPRVAGWLLGKTESGSGEYTVKSQFSRAFGIGEFLENQFWLTLRGEIHWGVN
jgi:hypothetical protein